MHASRSFCVHAHLTPFPAAYKCLLHKRLHHHGTLYICKHQICFSSTTFGLNVKVTRLSCLSRAPADRFSRILQEKVRFSDMDAIHYKDEKEITFSVKVKAKARTAPIPAACLAL